MQNAAPERARYRTPGDVSKLFKSVVLRGNKIS